MTPPDRAPEPLSDIVWELRNAAIDYGYASEPTEAERARLDRAHAAVLDAARDSRPVGEGLREAIESFFDDVAVLDKAYVTDDDRLLRAAVASVLNRAPRLRAALATDQPASTEAGEDG